MKNNKDKIVNKRTSWNKGLKGYNKGRIVSEETKKKQSESIEKFWKTPEGLLKKQRLSKRTTERLKDKTYEQIYGDKAEEIRRKIGDAQRGIPKSEEHNRKNSEAHRGKKRKPFSKEWRRKLGLATKDKTYEQIYGDKADIQRKKRSEALKGEKSYMWKDGISFEPYSLDWTRTLKRSIRQRDYYTCQVCGKEPAVHVHHIDYDKKNCNSENLITLCHSCHSKTNFNRDYWISYFKKLMPVNGWSDKDLQKLKEEEKKINLK